MKKYILKEQKTLSTILGKLISKAVNSIHEDKRYIITKVTAEKDLNNSVNIILEPMDGEEMGKPDLLVAIMKENKVEIRIKQENPYRNDLYHVIEVIIEPLNEIGRAHV